MKIKYSSLIPFKGFYAINLYGTMYIRKEFKDSPLRLDEYDINHEEIHSAQARDFCKINWIGYTIFYIFYFLFWLVELVRLHMMRHIMIYVLKRKHIFMRII